MLYANIFAPETPQSEPLDGRQVRNNAGGFVYALSDQDRLERWLILGTDKSTYYQSAQELTIENAAHLRKMIGVDGVGVVRTVVDVSTKARAPKQDAGIFALAACIGLGDLATRQAAFAAIPLVCRYHATFLLFLACVGKFRRGYSGGLQKAIRAWYGDRPVEKLAYDLVKYRERKYGKRIMNARNVFRMARPIVPKDDLARRALYDWAMGRPPSRADIAAFPELGVLGWFIDAQTGELDGAQEVAIARHLTHEMVPDAWKDNAAVWGALLENMPMAAMIRNLAKMTRVGLLTPRSQATQTVVDRLGEQDRLFRARIHPAAILTALASYRSGGVGGRGSKSHIPVPAIVEALDAAFYAAFPNLVPAGKRTLIGIDVSGSMNSPSAVTGLSSMEAATAIALFTANSEPEYRVHGFATSFTHIPVEPGQRIHDVIGWINGNLTMGGTDCALPMMTALQNEWLVDTFVVLTDNETWAGRIHPMEALRNYRRATGIPAKLVVAAMTASPFSVADPEDGGALDIVGFDANGPKILADFARGESVGAAEDADAA